MSALTGFHARDVHSHTSFESCTVRVFIFITTFIIKQAMAEEACAIYEMIFALNCSWRKRGRRLICLRYQDAWFD